MKVAHRYYTRAEEVPAIWTERLAPGAMIWDDVMHTWHVGIGTDLGELMFTANLTKRDYKMLEGMRISLE